MTVTSSARSKPGPSPRTFGLTIGPLLLLVAAMIAWRGHTRAAQLVEVVGGVLLLLGLVVPRALTPVLRAWMALGHAMGLVMTPVIFTLLWWLAFVPMGILRRTMSRSPLARDPRASTYWVARTPVADEAARAALERQF